MDERHARVRVEARNMECECLRLLQGELLTKAIVIFRCVSCTVEQMGFREGWTFDSSWDR